MLARTSVTVGLDPVQWVKAQHPLSLLLPLEWVILTLLVLARLAVGTDPAPETAVFWFLILLFGAMGLWIPQRPFHQAIYLMVEGIMILLAIALGESHGGQVLGLLLLIVLMRGCLFFPVVGRVILTGSTIVIFAGLQGIDQSPHLLRLWANSSWRSSPIAAFWLQNHSLRYRMSAQVARDPNTHQIVQQLRLNSIVQFSLVQIFVLLLINSLLLERQSHRQLESAHRRLRQFALQIEEQAMVQERNRIAREIHDALGHTLAAQSLQIENALIYCPEDKSTEQMRPFLREARRLGSEALSEVRQSVLALRTEHQNQESLEVQLGLLARSFQAMTGIEPEMVLQIPRFLSPSLKIPLFRIVQEALTNIRKHAEATQVRVLLQPYPDSLQLVIEDNGRGFDPEDHATGFGLQGMRERTLALGGSLQITSQPGQGCSLSLWIPWHEEVER